MGIIVVSTVWGAEQGLFSTRGSYGSLEYGYTKEKSSDPANQTTQVMRTQNYLLGMRGAIYSSNLLTYLAEGGFALTNTDSTSSGVESDSSSETLNYRLNADLIRSTSYPFSLYNEKTTTPYSSVSPGTSFAYEDVNERSGISGSVKLPYFLVNYRAEMSDMRRDESYAKEIRDNEEYMISVYKDYSEGRVSAVYNERFRDYLRDDLRLGSQLDWSDHSRDGRANWSWNIDKTLRVESSMTYMESSFADLRTLSGGVSFDWHPNETYNAGVNFLANTMEAGGYQNDTYTMNGYSSYQVTPQFTTTQNVSLYAMQGSVTEQTMETATVAGNYVKNIGDTTMFSASLSLMGKAEQNDVAEDLNLTLPDRNTFGYNASIGTSTMIDSLSTRILADLMYDDTRSTLDETTNRLSARISLITSLRYNLTNNLSVSHVTDESTMFTQNGLVARDIEVETVDNTLRFWQDVGYSGKLSLNGGVAYTITKSGMDEAVKRVFPHVEGSFIYRFWNGVELQSNAAASQDSLSDLTNYSAYLSLNYAIREIVMSLGSKYLLQTGGSIEELAQSSVFFKIKRTF